MPVKIAHLSDLHFCSKTLATCITQASQDLAGRWGFPLDVAIANDDVVSALKQTINVCDPDVICITGDLTAFGDADSFAMVETFLKDIGSQQGKPQRRKIVTVPGNHDSLASQIPELRRFLIQRVPRLLRPVAQWYLRPLSKALKAILRAADGTSPSPGFLGNYNALAQQDATSCHGRMLKEVIGDVSLAIVPFNSVSRLPFWLNIGATETKEFARCEAMLSEARTLPECVRIVLLHHNPFSTPDIIEPFAVNAYNSMPGASKLLHNLQESGVDLVLHGHQHQWVEYDLDYLIGDAGRLLIAGAPCATGGETPGFSMLVIDQERRITRTRYQYKDGIFRQSDDRGVHVLCQDTVRDPATILTQREIHKYRRDETDRETDFDWVYSQKPIKDLIVIGTALRKFRETRTDDVKELLLSEKSRGTRVRILMAHPEDKSYYSKFDQAASVGIREFGQLLRWADEQKVDKQLDIRVMPKGDAIPFSAAIRDGTKSNGAMVVELLPLGVWDETTKRPRMKLRRQHDGGVFRYYAEMAERMLDHATSLRTCIKAAAQRAI